MFEREAGLPVVEFNPRARDSSRAQARGIPMTDAIPRILLLRSTAVSQEEIRAAARRAGISLNIACAENRRDFAEQLRREPFSLILAGPDPMAGLELREVLERARTVQPPVPVILIGGALAQTESLRILRAGATDYLSSGELQHLPTVLARALRVRDSNSAQARTQVELERAAAMLRENQKLITIGRLSALISHEINNPLEAVTNLLYLVSEEKGLPQRSREYLSLAQRELERVGQISRQTLNFSRETATPVQTRMNELMEEVLALYARRIADKALHVERQYNAPQEALVYPGEMRQVLSNLVTNAIEASSNQGRLRVRIRAARNWSDPGVRGIRISVADTGSGIPAEVQRRLGEPFFTTKGQRGTGLGLWVTRSIIQRYGGDIHLRSSTAPHRHGTVFSIFLPTNMRPTMVDRNFDSDDGGSGSGASKTRSLTTSATSRNRTGATGRTGTTDAPHSRVAEWPPQRRASGE